MTDAQMAFAAAPRPRPRREGGALDAVRRSRACLGLLRQDGTIAVVNAAALDALGFAPEDDLTGLSLSSFWPAHSRAGIRAALQQARSGHAVRIALDLETLRPGGGCVTLSLSPCAMGLVLLALDPG
ncbi:PAS domain-containing protein [Jannaschia sp. LMIT008]|uniref:PAS domain-containing protein n=1 Tax=Jannaschia maritima TaxID=3032585 RepID=UPI002811D04F|nr:PAS domain-containing protein [Jannaschia sp. LMIT008]